jgi:hypothetical protein
MNIRKLFDSKPKRKLKSKNPKRVKAPKRYRYTYDEINELPDDKLEWIANNGYPEEQDMAHGIRSKRKMTRLLTYGY